MPKNKKFWKDVQRYIDSIRYEIKSSDPDRTSTDFWLFKIERRFKLLRKYIEKIDKSTKKSNSIK